MKKTIFLCFGLFAVVLLCIFLPKKSMSKRIAENTSYSISSRYTLREYEGQIAVFSDDSEMPVKVFDTAVSALPKSDREQLKLGITVETPEELQKLIEDFTG